MLTFRIFADDTNVFASARDLKSLEQLINTELKKVKLWCDANKLSINFSKTNFMIVKSPRKKDLPVNIKIESEDGTTSLLERKDRVKYLGVHLDDRHSILQTSYILCCFTNFPQQWDNSFTQAFLNSLSDETTLL